MVVVGRYYDPTTGQFLTVDPLVDETGQPYSYASGDPVNLEDPDGRDTVGVCVGAQGDLWNVISFQGEGCVNSTIFTSNPQIGATVVAGGGKGIGLEGGVDAYIQITNATSLSQLTKTFEYAQVAAGDGVEGSIVVFWSPDFKTYGVDLGAGFGGGAGGGVGASYTWLPYQMSGSEAAFIEHLFSAQNLVRQLGGSSQIHRLLTATIERIILNNAKRLSAQPFRSLAGVGTAPSLEGFGRQAC